MGQEGQRKKYSRDREWRYEERDNEETRSDVGEANNDTLKLKRISVGLIGLPHDDFQTGAKEVERGNGNKNNKDGKRPTE